MRRRILKYLTYKGISKYKFYQETGLSNGYLDKDADLNIASYEKISSCYTDLNMDWVRTGEGEMLKDESISQNAYGDNNQIAGRDINNGVRGNTTNTTTNNTTNNYKDCGACETSLLEKAIDEMGEQRKLFAEQINRLLTIIEKMNDK